MTSRFLLCAVFLAALVMPVLGRQSTPVAGSGSIWDGVYTDEQSTRGQQTYKQSCAMCHKEDLLGEQAAPALVGQDFLNRFIGSTADDMVQTIKASMPQEAPGSLSQAAYVDLVGYFIKSNGGPAGAAELPQDREALKKILVTRAR